MEESEWVGEALKMYGRYVRAGKKVLQRERERGEPGL